MDYDKKWMLMTYYCPTHGDSGRIVPVEFARHEILNIFKGKSELPKKNEKY